VYGCSQIQQQITQSVHASLRESGTCTSAEITWTTIPWRITIDRTLGMILRRIDCTELLRDWAYCKPALLFCIRQSQACVMLCLRAVRAMEISRSQMVRAFRTAGLALIVKVGLPHWATAELQKLLVVIDKYMYMHHNSKPEVVPHAARRTSFPAQAPSALADWI
jgi:hypothetical protein